MFITTLQNLLQCPVCMTANSLVFESDNDKTQGSIICNGCQYKFLFQNGILDFLSNDFSYLENKAWCNKLALQRKWWLEERSTLKHKSVKKKWAPSPTLIKKYFSLNSIDTGRHRTVLDVGCGEGDRYKNFFKMTYVGIDPLVLKNSYPFPFIRGVAELLPFIDNSIDVITAIESIDHFFDPKRSIKEMLRCLTPGGVLFVFVGDASITSEAYIDRQGFFTITEDAVHTYHFSTNYFQELLSDHFERLEIDKENDYVAIWGWNKIPR